MVGFHGFLSWYHGFHVFRLVLMGFQDSFIVYVVFGWFLCFLRLFNDFSRLLLIFIVFTWFPWFFRVVLCFFMVFSWFHDSILSHSITHTSVCHCHQNSVWNYFIYDFHNVILLVFVFKPMCVFVFVIVVFLFLAKWGLLWLECLKVLKKWIDWLINEWQGYLLNRS